MMLINHFGPLIKWFIIAHNTLFRANTLLNWLHALSKVQNNFYKVNDDLLITLDLWSFVKVIYSWLTPWNKLIIIDKGLAFWVDYKCFQRCKMTLLEFLSFATSHYAIGMQLIVVCNYLGHICNYKFGIV
jgi:hypothetical protein